MKKANCSKGQDAKSQVRKDGWAANVEDTWSGICLTFFFLRVSFHRPARSCLKDLGKEGKAMIGKNESKPIKRSLEIIHEGINFDLCRRVTLFEVSGGLFKVKMEAFITPKRRKDQY